MVHGVRRLALYLLVFVSVLSSVGAPIWSAVVADVDGALPWALVGLGALAAAVLGVVAVWGLWDGGQKGRQLDAANTHIALLRVDLEGHAQFISEHHADLDRLKNDPMHFQNESLMRKALGRRNEPEDPNPR